MSGYRFCRTDDIPLLVQAFNACWVPHFGAEQAITVESFKRDVRALNLWASSSMLAIVDDEPVGVLLGAKRDDANLVHRIAMKPGHERHGHGHHLLESLRQKVSILGPPRLTAEIPAEWEGVRRFLESCGFRAEARYVDFISPASGEGVRSAGQEESEIISPVTLDDLLEAGAIDRTARRSWERAVRTLENRRAEIAGLAIASDVRIEAYLLFRDAPACEIVALGETHPGLLHPLVTGLHERRGVALRIPRVNDAEISFAALESLGFRPEREWIGYTLDACG